MEGTGSKNSDGDPPPHLPFCINSSPSTSSSTLSPHGIRPDTGVSESPATCLREVIELVTLNTLCYPNSYWAELHHEPSSLLFIEGA